MVGNQYDAITEAKSSCPRIKLIQEKNRDSEIFFNFVQVLQENNIFERFRLAFDLPESKPLDIIIISRYYDNIICDKYERRKLP